MSTRRLTMTAIVAAILTVAWVAEGIGASFQKAPPTTGAYSETAYTLRGGEWQIGAGISVTPLPGGIELDSSSLSLTYGITNHLQVRIMYRAQFSVSPPFIYDFSIKLDLPLGENIDLGVPLNVVAYNTIMGAITLSGVRSGAVLSLRVSPSLALHGGMLFEFPPKSFVIRPYGIVDFDVFPGVQLVGEAAVMQGIVAAGIWLRPLDFLDIKLAMRPGMPFAITFYLQF